MRSHRPALTTGVLAIVIGAACVEQTDDKPTEEDLKVIKQNLLSAPPTPKHVTNANIDGKVTYLGIDVEHEPIEPGKDVKLTHYWKVVTPPGEGWRMFNHLSGPNKQQNINVDHGPIRGKYPVAQWKAGDIIRDEHTIRLPASWAHKEVYIYAGIWKGPQRMPVKSGPVDNENRVIAAVIPTGGSKTPPPRKRYLARKIAKPLKIDGKLDEPAWTETMSTGAFVNTMNGTPMEQKAEAKILWDAKTLYLGFQLADTDVWSNFTKRDDKLWTQEAIEVMLDADGDGKSYIELQVAPNGTMFDTYLPEYRKYEDSIDPKRKPFDWTSKMKAAVAVDGTVNKREDQDKGWTVEIALPMEDVRGLATAGPKVPPALGDVWRLNLFRMDMPKDKGQQASGWSPPLVGDFHALDKFGELVFADEKGQVPPPPSAMAPKPAVPAASSAVIAPAPVPVTPVGMKPAPPVQMDGTKIAGPMGGRPRAANDPNFSGWDLGLAPGAKKPAAAPSPAAAPKKK